MARSISLSAGGSCFNEMVPVKQSVKNWTEMDGNERALAARRFYASRPRTLFRRRCRKSRNRVGAPPTVAGPAPDDSGTLVLKTRPRSRQSIHGGTINPHGPSRSR